MCHIYNCAYNILKKINNNFIAYILTEDVAAREIDGVPNPLALGDMMSNVMPHDINNKKDKFNDLSVSKE